MAQPHSFHIPVMGVGFTIDTPLKVAQYGIDSVMTISDDLLLEKLRKAFCLQRSLPYTEINKQVDDCRAKRTTAYLNLVKELIEEKFNDMLNTASANSKEIQKYINQLPSNSEIKAGFQALIQSNPAVEKLQTWLKQNLKLGSLDVNIMTKLDRDNYKNGEKLPVEHNDAHATLRGYANSDLVSSIIFSAGMNPRLYGYIANFDDFYPDENGFIKKKIVLKVSDYRSALIQGKFLAKKGLWVSEYRIESGLNCGGHAFATDGYLMGPILQEFKEKKQALIDEIRPMIDAALEEQNRVIPASDLSLRITAQGGVGTADEHDFLLNEYKVDSIGWGSPFLLVPSVVNVEDITLEKLLAAKEEDLYLSDISPLGVPFNNLKDNTKDVEKIALAKEGKPGSPCPKGHLITNIEFTEKPICTASKQYQKLKIEELETKDLSPEEKEKQYNAIIAKACICLGLGNSVLQLNDIDRKVEGDGVSICPGPNLAYYDKKLELDEMIDHIYGRTNIISRTDRPSLFIKELFMYLDYFDNKINSTKDPDKKEKRALGKFAKNLESGIGYYENLFSNNEVFKSSISSLDEAKANLNQLKENIEKL